MLSRPARRARQRRRAGAGARLPGGACHPRLLFV